METAQGRNHSAVIGTQLHIGILDADRQTFGKLPAQLRTGSHAAADDDALGVKLFESLYGLIDHCFNGGTLEAGSNICFLSL